MQKPSQQIEIIPRRLYWLSDKTPPTSPKTFIFSTDDTYTYIPYNTDFGPLDISQIVKYCRTLGSLLSNPKHERQTIIHYSSIVPAKRANSALLMCAYQVLVMKRQPEEVWKPFSEIPRFLPYRDASLDPNKFELHILDCLSALIKAQSLDWLDLQNFDLDEYARNTDVHNGRFNWIVPEKIIAFPCPANRNNQGLSVEEYCRIFECCKVSTIVRVYQPTYESIRFKKLGFRHIDIEDNTETIPSESMIRQFIEICRRESVIAVHCSQGLGKSMTLIGCYVIRHYSWTGKEFIAWARMCRPGSVLGKQQSLLCTYYETLCALSRKSRQFSMAVCDYEKHLSPEITNRNSISVKAGHFSVKGLRQPVTYKTRFNQLVKIDPEMMKLYGKKGND